MQRDELQNIIYGALAGEIAGRVIDKLAEKRKDLFVVYTGARLGFEEATASMEKLAMDGYRFDVAYSDSGSRVVDLQRVQRTLNPTQILPAEEHTKEGFIKNPFAPLIVPALTTRSAAQIATLSADTAAAKIIHNSLMHGRDVIIAVDGCCPETWLKAGFPITDAMGEQMSKNLKQLEAYGAILANAKGLHKAVNRLNAGLVKNPDDEKPVTAGGNGRQARCDKRVVSAQDVLVLQPGDSLVVGGGSIVTQLAVDAAASRNVTIIKG